MQKLYCYVDESGQETEGKLFVVALVVVGLERDELEVALSAIEERTGKRKAKWRRSNFCNRLAYLEEAFILPALQGALMFAKYGETREYVPLTVAAVAKAILARAHEPYHATVFVDGLPRHDIRWFAHELRALHVRVKKVRGARDESDALIRLADAVAGFIRDYLDGESYARELYRKATERKVLRAI